jgi:putative nucleotidyltransferase with HDIG domain
MSVIHRLRKAAGKKAVNSLLFLFSIVAVTAIWLKGKSFNPAMTAGSFMLVSSCYLVLYLFLSHFRSEVLEVSRKTFFIIITILSFVVLTRLVSGLPLKDFIYLLPFAVIPVIIRIFFDARLALFILLVTIMLSGFMVPEPFEFIFFNFISGMAAIFTLTRMYSRAKLFITVIAVFLTFSILYTGLNLFQAGSLSGIKGSIFLIFALNSILVLLSYPVIFFFETRFLFLSDTTLLELSDTSQPLLRKMAEEAPGSFQHSLQVANLAEAAARIVGANPHLVRTGALYHDIGKIAAPSYFAENKSENLSPHDSLDPLESARVILNHVKGGIELARNFKLPVQIIDFIRTHHGTSVAYFFYRKYTDQNPWDTSFETEFMYSGPKPFSRETAIVMMANAVEAASRTIGNYSGKSIGELVDRIVLTQEQDGQLSEAPLTFREISDIKEVFKKRLKSIYHARIVYPLRNSSGG